MAIMRAMDSGDLPVDAETARERLPDAMDRLGYRPIGGGAWSRRDERCGWSIWSLPDACPATAWVVIDEAAGERRCRYTLTYRIRMPGQILAHTDAKALELEADRLRSLLAEEGEPDTRDERHQLARLTLAANVALTLAPAAALGAAVWLARKAILDSPPLQGLLRMVVTGLAAWLLALFVAVRVVVRQMNARVSTRVIYGVDRASRRGS